MRLTDLMTRAPRPFDPDRAREAPDLGADAAPLLQGVAGCSPFLARLMQLEATWLEDALNDPDMAHRAVLRDVRDLSLDTLAGGLRQAKRRVALLTALADLAGVWSLEQVTAALSAFAGLSVDCAIKLLVAEQGRRGKIPGWSDSFADTSGGIFALAMGKMGAGELNYSSDIDLILLFDDARYGAYAPEARAGFIRAARDLTRVLSDVTADGYVFRTDLRLRPDASVTPIVLSASAAEAYYESVGRTWERAAYIKAAPVAGDIVAGQRFLDALRPFVWRKHLDFVAIQDAHELRLRIRDHKRLGGDKPLEGYDVKLGRGGIREIEFFTQTRQLIAGGRDPDLRHRETGAALSALASAGWIVKDVADDLFAHYRAHREVEHRLQMIHDAQTHALPSDDQGFERLAAFMDTDVADLRATLSDRFDAVHALTEDFFAPAAAPSADATWGREMTERWPGYPALRSDRAVESFQRLWPGIQAKLKQAAHPDEALAQFDSFLSGLPAGVQLFALFEANPQLTDLMVEIAATAPALAQYLSRNASVFDAVIGGSFFSPWPGVTRLKADLNEVLAQAPDYEARLNAARRWAKEWHFRIGVHHLRGLLDADSSAGQYADLAEAVVSILWDRVVDQFAGKHGPPPGRGATVVGMGSLGAAQLNALSDLDLIVIYDAEGQEASNGPRPLATRVYYARLTQALVTALSAPMSEGRLYEVDMRLRPSGRQGPVATGWSAFQDYQQNEAWTWEHLALTRARPVAGGQELGAAIEDFRQMLVVEKGRNTDLRKDVSDMRARLARAKPGQKWNAKDGAGRLQDIALAAQTLAMVVGSAARSTADQITAGVAGGVLDPAAGEDLKAAHALFWRLQAAGRLLSGGTFDPDLVGEGGRMFVLRETGFPDMASVVEAANQAAQTADAIIAKLLEGPT